MDAQWADDFHHSLHALLTGERERLLRATSARHADLANAYRDGVRLPRPPLALPRPPPRRVAGRGMPGDRFVVCSPEPRPGRQPAAGDRLAATGRVRRRHAGRGRRAARAVRAAALHGRGVRRDGAVPVLHEPHRRRRWSRRSARAGAGVRGVPAGQGSAPDPQSEETFRRSALRWEQRDFGRPRPMLALYRELLRLRRELAPLRALDPRGVEVARATRPRSCGCGAPLPAATMRCSACTSARSPRRLEVPFRGEWRHAARLGRRPLRRTAGRAAWKGRSRCGPPSFVACWAAPVASHARVAGRALPARAPPGTARASTSRSSPSTRPASSCASSTRPTTAQERRTSSTSSSAPT